MRRENQKILVTATTSDSV